MLCKKVMIVSRKIDILLE